MFVPVGNRVAGLPNVPHEFTSPLCLQTWAPSRLPPPDCGPGVLGDGKESRPQVAAAVLPSMLRLEPMQVSGFCKHILSFVLTVLYSVILPRACTVHVDAHEAPLRAAPGEEKRPAGLQSSCGHQ